MSDGMGRELAYLSSHATNRYFIPNWGNSIDHKLLKENLLMELNELYAHDDCVDSWSDMTKNKCCSTYLTILRQSGLLNEKPN